MHGLAAVHACASGGLDEGRFGMAGVVTPLFAP